MNVFGFLLATILVGVALYNITGLVKQIKDTKRAKCEHKESEGKEDKED